MQHAINCQNDQHNGHSCRFTLKGCLPSHGNCSTSTGDSFMLSNPALNSETNAGSMSRQSFQSKVVEDCDLTVKAKQCTIKHLCRADDLPNNLAMGALQCLRYVVIFAHVEDLQHSRVTISGVHWFYHMPKFAAIKECGVRCQVRLCMSRICSNQATMYVTKRCS